MEKLVDFVINNVNLVTQKILPFVYGEAYKAVIAQSIAWLIFFVLACLFIAIGIIMSWWVESKYDWCDTDYCAPFAASILGGFAIVGMAAAAVNEVVHLCIPHWYAIDKVLSLIH